MFLSYFDEEGLLRVKRLYTEIYNGENSAEAGIVYSSWYHSLAIGAIVGSTFGIRPVYQDFKTRFNEYQFQDKALYARKLFDCTLATCLRNGIRIAWRSSLLAALFSCTACTLTVYHNDIRFSDLVFASAISGGFYTFHRGPKAMFAGATFFGLMGIPIAALSKLFLWYSGLSYSEFSDRARQYYDSPSIQRQKKLQKTEKIWKDNSITWIDDFKSYIYHQRRVDRLEKMGIVDDSFKNLKPTEGMHPKQFEQVNNGKH